MNNFSQTAQVPGQRSKTFGDHLKAALPYIGTALAVGGAAYGANKYYKNQSQNLEGANVNFTPKNPSKYRDPYDF